MVNRQFSHSNTTRVRVSVCVCFCGIAPFSDTPNLDILRPFWYGRVRPWPQPFDTSIDRRQIPPQHCWGVLISNALKANENLQRNLAGADAKRNSGQEPGSTRLTSVNILVLLTIIDTLHIDTILDRLVVIVAYYFDHCHYLVNIYICIYV